MHYTDDPLCSPYCPGNTPDADYFFTINIVMTMVIIALILILLVLIVEYNR